LRRKTEGHETHILIFVVSSCFCCFCADAAGSGGLPEVHADNRVTFAFARRNAKEVALALEGAAKDLPMQKDEQGVWSVTTEPLAA